MQLAILAAMFMLDEAILEPIARWARFAKGFPHIPRSTQLTLVDLGCGPHSRFFFFAQSRGLAIKQYIGIDPIISSNRKKELERMGPITIKNKPLATKIPLPTGTVDVVVAFAFLEHVDNPQHILYETMRILKPGGKAVITTPTYKAQKVLEFLAFKAHLISKREIAEHKQYFDKSSLLSLLGKAEGVRLKHQYFELGLNNLLILTKKMPPKVKAVK